MASWDQAHAIAFAQTMTELCDGKAKDLAPMLQKNREAMASLSNSEKALLQLSCDFVEYPGQTPDEALLLKLPGAWISIVDNALEASRLIDELEG